MGSVALLLAGCEVRATVDVRVREDGSGVVRLVVAADASAVRAVESGGVPIEQAIRLDDIAGAGWEVGAWVRAEDGSATITIRKPFETPEQVADIVAEAGGENGPLQDVRAERDAGVLATEYSLNGRIDLESVATGVQTDAELLANLTAQSVDPNVIDQQLLAQVKASFALEVVARFPGAEPQATKAEPGAVTAIDATASVRKTTRLVFIIAALALAVLAIVLWWRGRPNRRPRAPRKKPGPRSGPPRPRVPRPHVPHPHMPEHLPRPHLPPNVPRPHLPHPHLPGRSRPDAPPPPPRKPPMIPPGTT